MRHAVLVTVVAQPTPEAAGQTLQGHGCQEAVRGQPMCPTGCLLTPSPERLAVSASRVLPHQGRPQMSVSFLQFHNNCRSLEQKTWLPFAKEKVVLKEGKALDRGYLNRLVSSMILRRCW